LPASQQNDPAKFECIHTDIETGKRYVFELSISTTDLLDPNKNYLSLKAYRKDGSLFYRFDETTRYPDSASEFRFIDFRPGFESRLQVQNIGPYNLHDFLFFNLTVKEYDDPMPFEARFHYEDKMTQEHLRMDFNSFPCSIKNEVN
jgi:hypothetical protein